MPSLPCGREGRYFLTFPSVHHVLAGEEKLLASGASIRLVPTPREISSDCGSVLEFAPEDLKTILATARDQGIEYDACVCLKRRSFVVVQMGGRKSA